MASFEGNLFGRGNGRHGLLGRPTVEWAGYGLTCLNRSGRNRTSGSCYAIRHTKKLLGCTASSTFAGCCTGGQTGWLA